MNILLIGCGNIGRTLLDVWTAPGSDNHVVVVQPSLRHAAAYEHLAAVRFVSSIAEVPPDFMEQLVVLAVKPQNLQAIAPQVARRPQQAMVISMLAGIKLAQLQEALPQHKRHIRMMPNVALKTGESATLTVVTEEVSSEMAAKVEDLFAPTGSLVWLKEECELDSLTPISGSGPAYFFLLADILVEETVKMGFDEGLARKLVHDVFTGTASLIHEKTDYKAQIASVASKKGVTEATLLVMEPQMRETCAKAMQAALTRIKELSDENSR